MSDYSLSVEVAEKVLGWTGIRPGAGDCWGIRPLWGYAPSDDGFIWTRLPILEYGEWTDRAEEAIIERGLGDAYAATLKEMVGRGDVGLLIAEPEVRCRAMLKVVGS